MHGARYARGLLVALVLIAGVAKGQNLVANGDFESGYDTGWNHLAGNGSSADYSPGTLDPHQGSTALKVQIHALGPNSWDVQSLGPDVSLNAGEEYVLTFWGRAATAGTSVRMVVQNSVYLSSNHGLGTGWAKYSWTFTAAEATPRIRLHYFETGTVWLDDIQLVSADLATVTLSPGTRHQAMAGFGGALSLPAKRIYNGSAANAAAIEQLMFEDSGLDVLRLKNWYYPDDPAARDAHDVASNLYYAAKLANANIQVLLSSWSPPANLKSNDDRKNGGTLKSDAGGFMYDELAQYWVDALDNLGWTPDYLSFQNEPGWVATWESCVFDPTETASNAGYAEAADAIWDAIRNRPDVPLMLGSDAENVDAFLSLNAPLLSRAYFAVHGYHVYNIGDVSAIDSSSTLQKLRQVRDAYGDRPNWMTEFSKDTLDWIHAARVVHNTLVEANASAYIYWKLAWADTSDTMIAVESDGSYQVRPHFYTIKHYAKHVDVGYQRIEVDGSTADIKVSGFISPDDSSITLVAINKATSTRQIYLGGNVLAIDSVAGYQSVSESFYQLMPAIDIGQPIDLPAQSLTTLVLTLPQSGPASPRGSLFVLR